jgi:uncharacterized protein YxjI
MVFMEEDEIKKYAEESLKEGYSKEELQNVLEEEGYSEEEVEGILTKVDEEKFRQSLGNPITNLDLRDNEYEVVQKIVRNKYKVFNSNEELVLKASQKMFRAKESFSFKNKKDEPVFNVEAEQMLDFSGDYTLTDAETDEAFAVLEKEFTLFQHRWKVKTPNGSHAADITSRGGVLDLLRGFSEAFSMIPHKYTVETPEGEELGVIQGEFGLKDRYSITINESGDIPKEALIAAAVTADALEGD